MRWLMMATVGLASLTCCAPHGEIPQSLPNDPVWKRANHLPITSEEQQVVDAYGKRAAEIAKQAKAKSSASVDAALALEEKAQQELNRVQFEIRSPVTFSATRMLANSAPIPVGTTMVSKLDAV